MISDITWDVFLEYAALGVMFGITLGCFCLFWSFAISRFRSAMSSAIRVGDL